MMSGAVCDTLSDLENYGFTAEVIVQGFIFAYLALAVRLIVPLGKNDKLKWNLKSVAWYCVECWFVLTLVIIQLISLAGFLIFFAALYVSCQENLSRRSYDKAISGFANFMFQKNE